MLQEWLDGVRAVPSRLQESGEKLISDLADAPTKIVKRGEWARDAVEQVVTNAVETSGSTLQRANMRALTSARTLLERVNLPEGVSEQAEQVMDQLENHLLFAPITGYDDMGVRPILKQIHTLNDEDLERLRVYETKHASRKTILTAIGKEQGRRERRTVA